MTLKNKLFFIVLITMIFSQDHDHGHDHGSHSHHSGIIRGSIVDSITEKPKQYANISIVKADTDDIIDGGISDEEGLFLIDDIPYGKYYVVIEYIGYETHIIDDIAIYPTHMEVDVDKITISQKMITIDGVSVVATAPIIEDIEKTTYPVAETARASGGAADEVLEQLPSISVDMDGNIALRGNTNVTILIDGRKSQLSIDMLNANMIEKVEVMTTPSAKYDPDGMAGIINIVLSKNEFVGNSGNLNFNQSTFIDNEDHQVDGGQNLSGTLNFFKNDWNIFTTYSLSSKYKQGEGRSNTLYSNLADNPTENIVSEYYINKHPIKNNFKIGIEQYPNDKALIAFDLTYVMHEGTDTTTTNTRTTTYDNTVVPVTSEEVDIETLTIENEEGEDLNYGFGYFIDNKENNKSFSIEFDYDDHNDKESQTGYINQALEDKGIDKIFSIDYSAPILNSLEKDSKYEIGIKWNKGDDIHETTVEGEGFQWDYDNQISAIYFNTAYYFTNSFGMQVGARFEDQEKHSIISYDEDINCAELEETECIANGFCDWNGVDCDESLFKFLINDIGSGDIPYAHTRIYPSLYFMYDTQGNGNFKFEFGRRIKRPWHHALDPIPDLDGIDRRFIDQGNPFLKPEDTYKSEISYSNRTPFGFLKTGIYYNQVTDKIDRDANSVQYDFDGNGEIEGDEVDPYKILTWDNIAKSTEVGMEITFITKPLPNIDLMLNGNYWHNTLESSYEDQADQLGDEYGFWGMMTSQIRLKNEQQISIYAHHSSPMTLVTGEISPFKRMDISYKKKVNDKFSFTIKLKDVFDTGGFGITTDQLLETSSEDPELTEGIYEYLIADHRRDKRSLSFNLEYRFGAFQKKKYRRAEGKGHDHGGGEGLDAGY